jgi:hypothetical protein
VQTLALAEEMSDLEVLAETVLRLQNHQLLTENFRVDLKENAIKNSKKLTSRRQLWR